MLCSLVNLVFIKYGECCFNKYIKWKCFGLIEDLGIFFIFKCNFVLVVFLVFKGVNIFCILFLGLWFLIIYFFFYSNFKIFLLVIW